MGWAVLAHRAFCLHLKRFIACLGLVLLPAHAWSSETALRVAFVYNFIKFIDWPSASASQHLSLCVVNPDMDMQDAFEQLNGKTVKTFSIELIFLKGRRLSEEQINSCHMLYRPGKVLQATLPEVIPANVVVVSDNADAKDSITSINLLMNAEGHLEFTINNAMIANAGVVVSSQLLKLARNNRQANNKNI